MNLFHPLLLNTTTIFLLLSKAILIAALPNEEFNIVSGVKKSNKSWCVQPSGSEAGSPLELRECSYTSLQTWKADETGQIIWQENEKLCIRSKEKKKLKLGKCKDQPSLSNSFVQIDDTIVTNKNKNRVFWGKPNKRMKLKKPTADNKKHILSPQAKPEIVLSFPEGANTLFIGHSFFVPIANQFGQFATKSGNYPNHNLETFFRGGEGGSPVNLWNNDKADIEAIFNSATSAGTPIELFGLTAGAPSDLNSPPGEVMQYYSLWIDLAISYNPNVSIYIGLPWSDFPAEYSDATVYSSTIQDNADYVWDAIQDLREQYPDTNIFYLNYANIVSTMRHLFEDDELVGIDHFIKPAGGMKRESLFTDTKGHGGPMMLDMMGLAYLQWFYGTPISTLINAATKLGWNKQNAKEIFKISFLANWDYRILI